MRWTRCIFHQGLIISLLCYPVATAEASPATDYGLFNTGVDNQQDVLADNILDSHYEMIEPSHVLGAPFVTTAAGGFPVPPWLDDNHLSAWLAPAADTNGDGDIDGSVSFTFRTTFDLTGVDFNNLEINGRWSTDNTGLDILLNGESLAFRNDAQFGGWSPFTLDAFFQDGINTVDFLVNNGAGATDPFGPIGLRVEFEGNGNAPPPPPPAHPHAIPGLFPTGVDNTGQALVDDNAVDPHYTIVLDPLGNAVDALTTPNDGFPIPPWIANDINSRWISPPAADGGNDANGEPGTYVYETTFDMTNKDVNNAVIFASRATDDTGPTVLLNGVEIPMTPSAGFASKSWFVITPASAREAGADFVPGVNSLGFVVDNGGDAINPTGLRIDDVFARAAPADSTPIPGLFNTGVGDDNLPLGDFEADPHYTLTSGPDDTLEVVTVTDDDFPIPPWFENTASSRWISVDLDEDGNGAPGDYEFTMEFDMTGLDVNSAVIMGLWSTDNTGSDILLNGVATGNPQAGSFPLLSPFEISSEQGDVFLPGINTLTFLVNNAGNADNPIGLRVEGLVAFVGGGLRGDFNSNGMLDIGDIDDLTAQSASGNDVAKYDLNGDNQVDDQDVTIWVKDLRKTWIGDANLDNEFNSSDLVDVLAAGKYELDEDAVWSSGDFNGDGRANSTDLVVALADGGYELGPVPGLAAVPEPNTLVLIVLGGLSLLGVRRRVA